VVILHDVKTVNGWQIRERTGHQAKAERLPRYAVFHPDGRTVEEFRRLASAEKWCRENDDASGQKKEVREPGCLDLFGERLKRAHLVAAYLNDELDTDRDRVWLEAYSNCREQGFCLKTYDKVFCFSEYRNSDSIVVYVGHHWDFYPANIPSDGTFAAAKFFPDEISAAAFILQQLKGF
jgi:hypothetical protein